MGRTVLRLSVLHVRTAIWRDAVLSDSPESNVAHFVVLLISVEEGHALTSIQ